MSTDPLNNPVYARFGVTPLINAVKELSEQNKELEKRIQELENKKE